MKLPENWLQGCIQTAYGAMGVRIESGEITELIYLPTFSEIDSNDNPLIKQCYQQIEQYLIEPSFQFQLPLRQVGTSFQRKVWQAIAQIPCGEVRTYGEIAKQIRSAPRAVGQACGSNPYPLIVPCHRVVAANGIGGFAHHAENNGFHHQVKLWLLKHEGVISA